jgi:hypothetical protein
VNQINFRFKAVNRASAAALQSAAMQRERSVVAGACTRGPGPLRVLASGGFVAYGLLAQSLFQGNEHPRSSLTRFPGPP